eukprot:jgi/Chrpa1/13447/Chrysochromulina_OHIO_Genome00011025-RA
MHRGCRRRLARATVVRDVVGLVDIGSGAVAGGGAGAGAGAGRCRWETRKQRLLTWPKSEEHAAAEGLSVLAQLGDARRDGQAGREQQPDDMSGAARHAAREERTLTAALGSGGSGHLLALPMELLVHVLPFLSFTSVLRFSDGAAGPRTVNQHGWRAAYPRTARLESPLILQLSSFRSLVGFAHDARPTASSRLIDKAAADAADAAVGDALRSLGLTGACPLRGADVVVVSAVSDRESGLEPTLCSLFERGAARVQLADEACATLRRAGKSTGTAIFFGLESVCVACVMDRERLPPPRAQRAQPVASLRHAVEYLAATARELPPNAPLSAALAAAAARAEDDEEDEDEADTLRRLAGRNRSGNGESATVGGSGLQGVRAVADAGAVVGVGAIAGTTAVVGTTASLEVVGGAVVGATAAAQAARSSLAGAGGATAGGTSAAAGAGAVSSTDRTLGSAVSSTLGSAVSSTLGSAVSSTRRRGADSLGCYVRAVSAR